MELQKPLGALIRLSLLTVFLWYAFNAVGKLRRGKIGMAVKEEHAVAFDFPSVALCVMEAGVEEETRRRRESGRGYVVQTAKTRMLAHSEAQIT